MRRTTLTTVLATAVATAALIVSGFSPAAANPHGGGGGDGSQPLPGYTVQNPPLAPLTVGGRPATVKQGTYRHAAYQLEIPPKWNGELVMWAHGYRGTGTVLTVDPPGYGLRQKLLDQGYAWAASSYAENNYNVATGVTSTHDLATHAAKLIGKKPGRTYVAGVSMGGHVIGRSLEQYPKFYAGALPMCGVLGDNELFDYFLSFNLVAQDLADTPAYPAPADYLQTVVPTIQAKLGLAGLVPGGPDTTNDLGKQLRAVTTNLTGGPRPGDVQAFSVWKDFLFTLATPDNGGSLSQNAGRVAQNTLTRYTPSTPVNVNRSVQRVVASDLYSKYTPALTQIPRIFGLPRVPTLTLHGLGDLFVPLSMEQIYAKEVRRTGQSGLLVQRAVRAAGHCEFTPAEVGTAWDDLTTWVEAGKKGGPKAQAKARPAGDDVTTPSVVAAATYGCRFTDPTAYSSPALYPTRPLYPPCPTS